MQRAAARNVRTVYYIILVVFRVLASARSVRAQEKMRNNPASSDIRPPRQPTAPPGRRLASYIGHTASQSLAALLGAATAGRSAWLPASVAVPARCCYWRRILRGRAPSLVLPVCYPPSLPQVQGRLEWVIGSRVVSPGPVLSAEGYRACGDAGYDDPRAIYARAF